MDGLGTFAISRLCDRLIKDLYDGQAIREWLAILGIQGQGLQGLAFLGFERVSAMALGVGMSAFVIFGCD